MKLKFERPTPYSPNRNGCWFRCFSGPMSGTKSSSGNRTQSRVLVLGASLAAFMRISNVHCVFRLILVYFHCAMHAPKTKVWGSLATYS